MDSSRTVISPAYDAPLRSTLLTQVISGCIAALILDGGTAARVVGVAVLAFWLCAAIILACRPFNPTRIDLAIMKWGYWGVLLIAILRQALA